MAVKELHGTNSVQNNAEMFGEAETLNSLRHPCIIAFYGVVVNQVCLTCCALHVVPAEFCMLFLLCFGLCFCCQAWQPGHLPFPSS